MRRALELALLNPILNAEQAKELGIVTRIVPAASLAAEATTLAETLAAGPTQSLKAVKRLLRESMTASLETQLENETLEVTEASRRADGVEGIRAFAERRAPKFRGA
jgi:2-(1,2-epoxy-1,2-dihydrophenyl)acetyl-CoA isomerase